ncbi:MAG TPA: DUF3108 domain-containing protein [Burkholderiales bacterium]|nr:DUF3108 domain-containing protein [Burkholderiales bacterium]
MRNWSIPIAISAWFCACAHAAPPARVEIDYNVLRNGSVMAEVVDRFEHDGNTYRVVEEWHGKGLFALLGGITRTSSGTISSGALRPLEFSDVRTGRDPVRAVFDWADGSLKLEADGKTRTQSMPAHAQDKLSMLYAFAFNLPGTAPVSINATDGKGVSRYVFEAAGGQEIDTPAGRFDALRLVKRKEGPEDHGTEIWLARAHGYLPIRVLISDKDGTRIDQIVTRIGTP